MKYFKNITRLALCTAAFMALAHSASAQVPYTNTISADRAWRAGSSNLTGGGATFDDGYFALIGNTVSPDNSNTATIGYTNYPTYDNSDTDNNAIKMTMGTGRGIIKVYHRDQGTHSTTTTTTTTTTLSVSNGSTSWGNNSANGNVITFNDTWGGYGWWLGDVDASEVKLTVAEGSIDAQFVVQFLDYDQDDSSTYGECIVVTKPVDNVYTAKIPTDKHVKYMYLQNKEQTGDVTVTSLEYTVNTSGGTSTETVTSNCVLKYNQTGAVSGTTTIGDDTKVLCYRFNLAEPTDFFISGGFIGGIDVIFEDGRALQPITDDFFWYYNGGGGIYSAGYSNNNQLFRLIGNFESILADATSIPVNGDAIGNGSNHCYALTANDAFGFKLDPTKKYRIKVHADKHNVLYMGSDPATAQKVTANTVHSYLGTNMLTTYTIENSGDVYWIKDPDGLKLAGFEILPFTDTKTLDDVQTISSTTSIWLNDFAVNEVNKSSNESQIIATAVTAGKHGDYIYVSGPTMAMQSELTDGHKTVFINNGNAIGFKLPKDARLTFNVVTGDNATVTLQHNGTSLTCSKTDYTTTVTYPSDDSYTTEAEEIWITGTSGTYVKVSGFNITVDQVATPHIEFDTNVDGIYTGKYNDKLLVYCTDNGTTENFVLPRVRYVDGSSDTDVTSSTTFNFTNVKSYSGGGTSNASPTITINNGKPWLNGFEDTDNDKLYLVTCTYNGHEETFYVWFANYLKVGWWTNRDAKLIVDFLQSKDDPDNIITGEFYVSSASTGNMYYQMFDYAGLSKGDIKCSWRYTADNGTNWTTNEIEFDPDEKNTGETTTWTYTNDDKNHIFQSIRVPFPSESEINKYWNNKEVVKDLYFTAERSGWPDWTVHLKFHFVRAPKVDCTVSNNVGTTTMTGYKGAYTATPASDAVIYYTTDGTAPVIEMNGSTGTPKYATYTYSGPITSTRSTTFYATEMIPVARAFYINNPFTIHVEGKEISDQMGSTNQSTYFPAMSRPLENFDENTFSNGTLVLNDEKVEYVNSSNMLERVISGTATQTSLSATFDGGRLYSYPWKSGVAADSKGNVTYSADDGREMNVLFGDIGIKVYNNSNNQRVFSDAGAIWKNNGNFTEHLDAANYRRMTQGANYGSQNGNPMTECNLGIGGAGTEDGGMFLQPVGGDFMRFEPEYDGVITVWIRQNGAGQGNESKGDITRRPVYILDENGKVMKRSTIKPSEEHFFGINGTYAEINSNKASMRQDCRIDWINGLSSWRGGYGGNSNSSLPDGNKETFRLFNYWYGFPIYWNKNTAGHSNGAKAYTIDVPDSWISRTAYVQSVICPWNSICYNSEALRNKETSLTFSSQAANDKRIKSTFAKYGYEMPSYGVVRYRIPVKAGKTYYMGGRGTKNGFVAYKFDVLEANYNPSSYVWADNRSISEANFDCTDLTVTPGVKALPDNIKSSYTTADIQMYSRTSAGNDINATMKNLTDDNLNLTDDVSRGAQEGLTSNVALWRGMRKGHWYSIVLPFSVSESRMREIFGDGVQVLYLDPYDNTLLTKSGEYKSAASPAVSYNKLRFTYHKYQMLYANTPAFICPSKNVGQATDAGEYETNVPIRFPRVTIDKTNLGDQGYEFDTNSGQDVHYNGIGYKIGEVGDWEYWVTGTYDYRAPNAGEMYFMHGDTNLAGIWQTTIYHSTSGIEVQPTRCWIEPRPKPGATGVPPRLTEITFDSGDDYFGADQSGIEDIIMDDYTVDSLNDGNVYDMLGRKVGESTEGLAKGVYIHNGRKIYIR